MTVERTAAPPDPVSRRDFLKSAGAAPAAFGIGAADAASTSPVATPAPAPAPLPDDAGPRRVVLRINGERHVLMIEPRVTLLDALREHAGLSGSKKGCDRGQCGACTVLVDGRRVNACLTLAVMQEDREITTIEGLGRPGHLHAMQAAFVEHDAFQCGYCTPGQICSAVALLDEARRGQPSQVTPDLAPTIPIALDAGEIRERMSGNLCRCGAYPNIVRAVESVATPSMRPAASS